jgi:hypothetical protein
MLIAISILAGCASGPNWTRRLYSLSLAEDPPMTNAPDSIVALNRVAISPLFQSRSFTYRTGENSYEQDPYAGFMISPERALGESIRASMRAGGIFGRVVEPGSSLIPTLAAEVFVTELYGDFRNSKQPVGKMEIHFLCYEVNDGSPRRIVLDKVYAHEEPLTTKSPGALVAAWDADLHDIMHKIESEYAKAYPNEYP